MTIKLAQLSSVTVSMTDAESKQWEVAVGEAAPVLNEISKYLERKLAEADTNMRLDTILKHGGDVTITLLTRQAERDALNTLLDLFKQVD